MDILGIITEYNPFHNGHLYHIEQSKKLSKPRAVVCIMNGNFVQRGEPALIDKWSRTKMALKNGVDLVIELPLIYGIRSAEFFADGAIQLFKDMKIVDQLVFGSEIGKIAPIKRVASILANENNYFKKRLKIYLSKGKVFPKARELALVDFLKYNGLNYQDNLQELQETITNPNNILGVEYLKAILRHNADIKPFTIKRKGAEYHDKDIKGKIASATGIRNNIFKRGIDSVKNYMPEKSFEILKRTYNKKKVVSQKNVLGRILLAKLRTLTPDELKEYTEIDHGLEKRIINSAHKSGDWEELIDNIKTRAFTRTRIQRNLLHILFDIKERDFKYLDEVGLQYLRILGFTSRGERLLSELKEKANIPLITSPADYMRKVNTNSSDPLIKSLSYDLLATDIYTLLYPAIENRKGHLDFIHPLVKC